METRGVSIHQFGFFFFFPKNLLPYRFVISSTRMPICFVAASFGLGSILPLPCCWEGVASMTMGVVWLPGEAQHSRVSG